MKKFITGIVLAAVVLLGPVTTSAQTVSTTTASAQIQSLLAQIANLQAQIKALQDLQAQVKTAQTNVNSTLSIMRNLREGMSGEDVTTLQTILASDPDIYPQGIITGYYGKQTAEALRKFQKKLGLEAVGYVGPKTLQKLNQRLKELGLLKEGNKLCVPPGHLIAKGWQKKHDRPTDLINLCNSNGQVINNVGNNQSSTTPTITNTASPSVVLGGVIYDRATLSLGKNPTGTISFNVYGPNDTVCTTPLSPAPASVTVNGNGTYTSGNFTPTAVGTYRFIATYSGDSRNVSVRTNCNDTTGSVNVTAIPDTTAPVISALVATPSATSTIVSWTTDEPSTSFVWFGTSNPFSLASSALSGNNTLTTNHSVSLTNLATSTAYTYQVVSSDASGNTATSTQTSFVTLTQ